MNAHPLPILLVLASCTLPKGAPGDPDSGVAEDTGGPALTCDSPPATPLTWAVGRSLTPSLGFALTPDGTVLSIDPDDNVIETFEDGSSAVLVESLRTASNVARTPDGEVLALSYGGALVSLSTDGRLTSLTTNLDSPFGLGVDPEGYIYVSELYGHRVIRFAPDTYEVEILSDQIYQPNGLAFSADYSTIYVVGNRSGLAHTVQQDDQGRWITRVLAHVPALDDETPCSGLAETDDCLLPWGGVGSCQTDGAGALECDVDARDWPACDGLAVGDPCTTTVLGEPVDSVCTEAATGLLFCPSHDTARLDACVEEDSTCATEDRGPGSCVWTWEGTTICVHNEDLLAAEHTCDGLSEGDACVYDTVHAPRAGRCGMSSEGLVCEPTDTGGSASLNGVDVDSCEQVYVTQQSPGRLWRIGDEGQTVEMALELPTELPPSIHFGSGASDLARDTLYVMDRVNSRLIEVYPGFEGATVGH